MPERVIHIAKPDTGEEEWRALREPPETGWLTQGPKVAAFEHAFAVAAWCAACHCDPPSARPRSTSFSRRWRSAPATK